MLKIIFTEGRGSCNGISSVEVLIEGAFYTTENISNLGKLLDRIKQADLCL